MGIQMQTTNLKHSALESTVLQTMNWSMWMTRHCFHGRPRTAFLTFHRVTSSFGDMLKTVRTTVTYFGRLAEPHHNSIRCHRRDQAE